MKKDWILGIDEVGRGPIAGPVTLGLVYASPRVVRLARELYIRDSKAFSSKKREQWFDRILSWQEKGWCTYVTASVSAPVIDRRGIMWAIRKAMARGLSRVEALVHTKIFLDGGLYAPKKFIDQETIIKGDTKIEVIAMASIMAKVTRDRYMVRQDKKFPDYGFAQHKGYGTKRHYVMLQEKGVCSLHRTTWLKS
jgi:ribonuclease HII